MHPLGRRSVAEYAWPVVIIYTGTAHIKGKLESVVDSAHPPYSHTKDTGLTRSLNQKVLPSAECNLYRGVKCM